MLRSMAVPEYLTLSVFESYLNGSRFLTEFDFRVSSAFSDTLLSLIPLIEIPDEAQLVLNAIIHDEGYAR